MPAPDDAPIPAIRFQRPTLPTGEAIERYFALARAERRFANGGPCARLLAERLGERTGSLCVPVASGTAGLMAAVVAVLGEVAPARGAEALVPSFTFPATAQAVLWAGLTPRLLDVDPAHWHLDPDQLERELEQRAADVALVVAVSAFGTPPPPAVRARWERACAAAGIPLVVDSAAGFGAVAADGVPIGAQGDVEVVSFHATKPFAVGEGGAVFTRDAALHARVERVVNFGFGAERTVEIAHGLNGKLSEQHAATALAVLDGHDAVLATRRAAATELRQRARTSAVAWQDGSERSTWQFVPAAFADPTAKARARACAEGSGIETRTYYEPLHHAAPFRDWPRAAGGLAQTDALVARLLCLPMANDLTAAEVEAIAAVVATAAATPGAAAPLTAQRSR